MDHDVTCHLNFTKNYRKLDQLGHRYAHTSYEVFVPWTLYRTLMCALPQVAKVFCVHLLHTSYLSLTSVAEVRF